MGILSIALGVKQGKHYAVAFAVFLTAAWASSLCAYLSVWKNEADPTVLTNVAAVVKPANDMTNEIENGANAGDKKQKDEPREDAVSYSVIAAAGKELPQVGSVAVR